MIASLQELISGRKFEAYRSGLEQRFRVNRLNYIIRYGEPPSHSLLVRLESKERIGEICVWEWGDCEVQLAEFEKDGIQCVHYDLQSEGDFHARLAEVFCFVADREPTRET